MRHTTRAGWKTGPASLTGFPPARARNVQRHPRRHPRRRRKPDAETLKPMALWKATLESNVMKHWMMWTAGLSLALGVAAGPAIAADKAASKPAASKRTAGPANPVEDWVITAVAKENGAFDYCAAGTRFDN